MGRHDKITMDDVQPILVADAGVGSVLVNTFQVER